MANDVLVVAEHLDGKLADITFEMIGKAKSLAGDLGGGAVVALVGAPQLAGELGAADRVVTIDHPSLQHYTSEGWEIAVTEIVGRVDPKVILFSTSTIGLDLAGAISVACEATLVSYVIALQASGGELVATAQIYGGKLLAEVEIAGPRAACAVIGGSFPGEAGRASGTPTVEAVDPPGALGQLRTGFLSLIAPEAGDVDITACDALVAVGRGLGSQDNLELLEELSEAMGAPLAASRPVTDQGWLPKTRQVGKSGTTVKPKVYLTFGISGAPEHLEGMRDAELIIACNTDEKAPIFGVAHYGTTADLFDLVPALTDKLS